MEERPLEAGCYRGGEESGQSQVENREAGGITLQGRSLWLEDLQVAPKKAVKLH